MIAYTGIETISNMAEEAKDAARRSPQRRPRRPAVLGLYLLIPIVALSAMPVTQDAAGHYTTALGSEFANDPILGIVENLGLSHGLDRNPALLRRRPRRGDPLIATNAGLIGVSRLTYSMGQHRQLPEGCARSTPVPHPLHRDPRLRRDRDRHPAPGQTDFLATMYSFGAMLSFTIAHVAVIQLRATKSATSALEAAAQLPRLRLRGADDRRARRPRHLCRLDRGDGAQPAHARRRPRLDGFGIAVYVLYRRNQDCR
jgi:APA family basic amino acid/polyamine antiporter